MNQGRNIKSLNKKLFWIVLAGVIFFFGILTFLMLQREKEIILNLYKEKTSQSINLVANDLIFMMIEDNPQAVAENIRSFRKAKDLDIGVVGKNGLPAFGANITVPKEIFDAQKEHYITSGNEFIFFKPLINAQECHGCHSAKETTRGMIVIKTSMISAQKEIAETAKRLLIFAIFLGLASELFLMFVLRKIILIPLEKLNEGATFLKNGQLDHRVEIATNDEISELAASFNQMAESIEASHVNLEKAVIQKTGELRVIAELSTEVFKGDNTLRDIIEQCLTTITETDKLGFDYAVFCLIEKETGLLHHEVKLGIADGLCNMEIPLGGDHPLAIAIREAKAVIKKHTDLKIHESFNNLAIIPLLSHQRKRCREINLCSFEDCPAFKSPDERCWLVSNTLCRSPQSVSGKEKIYGCLHCPAFPVIGALIAGKKSEISPSSLHSLSILAAEIVSAVENQWFIEGKKEDVRKMVALHDISVESLQVPGDSISKNIVLHAAEFSNTDASVLWLISDEARLQRSDSFQINPDVIPEFLQIKDSFPGQAVEENRCIETIHIENIECLHELIQHHGFLYAASIPMKIKDTLLGCITLFKKKDFFMTDSEKAIILLFASQAAAALNTATLYRTLVESYEFSDAIFNCASSGIMVTNKEERVLKINHIGAEILRLSLHDIIGKRIVDIYPETKDMFLFGIGFGREITVSLPDGSKVPIGFTNSPLYYSPEAQEGIIVLFRDLTEIKKLQEELRKKEHFATMGMVISGVAHEVRNPLFGITSIGQILERELELPQHKALTQAMLKEADRMKRIIDELLVYSKPSKLIMQDIDAGTFFEEMEHHVKAINDLISFSLNMPAHLTFKADRDKMVQVCLNLLNNAIDTAKNSITISVRPLPDFIEIKIADDGEGIRKEHLSKIFDPFFTTKKGGTGLGLAICKKIVEDHGGSITIDSVQGEGTTVTLLLKA